MRIFKRILLVLLLLLGVPALALLLGVVVPHPAIFEQPIGTPLTQRILVVSNPIHTDIAIPLNEQSLAALPFLVETGLLVDHPAARWLLIGWGGRAFYLETPSLADMKPEPTFKR
jgi:uncharacterized protein (TIGR02117 family)